MAAVFIFKMTTILEYFTQREHQRCIGPLVSVYNWFLFLVMRDMEDCAIVNRVCTIKAK